MAAYLVYKILKNYGEKLARHAELLVLFNPLLIWVSSAWGMFDIWMINFILLFLLFVRKKKGYLAGIALALSFLTKQFPVFFLPVLIVYLLGVFKKPSNWLQIIPSFVVAFGLVSIPFFLTSPRGFLNLNLIMHLIRPPQGLSIPAMVYGYSQIYHFNSSLILTVSSILMVVLLMVLYFFSLSYVKKSESRLLLMLTLIYFVILLFNKVTNEQYFVVLVVMLLLLRHMPKTTNPFLSRRLLHITELLATYGTLVGATFLGFHFFTFLPPWVTTVLFKTSTLNLVFYLSRVFPNIPLYAYPDSAFTYYNLPTTITSIVFVPFFVINTVILVKALKNLNKNRYPIKDLIKDVLARFYAIRNYSRKFLTLSLTGCFLLGIIFVTGMILEKQGAFKPVLLISSTEQAVFPKHPRVGTFYNVWWNNPSHHSSIAYGNWGKTTLTPLAGYYTSKNSYFVQHIKEMKQAGIDFAIVSYHLYDRERYLTFGHYAERLGLYYTPLIESDDVLAYDSLRPVGPDNKPFVGSTPNEKSQKALENVILSSVSDNYKSPALLRINNKPVIFIYDSHWYFPSWDKESKENLANIILQDYSKYTVNPYQAITNKWGKKVASLADMIKYYPPNLIAFHDLTPMAEDYRNAFLTSYTNYWKAIRYYVESKVGPVYFITTITPNRPNWKEFTITPDDFSNISVFDAEFFYSPSNTWDIYQYEKLPDKLNTWAMQVKQQADRSKKLQQPLFVPVIPQYNDTKVRPDVGFKMPKEVGGNLLYDWSWKVALDNNANYVLVATWNEFFEGTAIEPSKENGYEYITDTKKWSDILKDSH